MQRRHFLGALAGSAVYPLAARAQWSVMPISGLMAEEAQSIAQEAYIYLYPLVIMDATRKHFSNIEAGKKVWSRINEHAFARAHVPTSHVTECHSPQLRYTLSVELARFG